MCFLPHFKTCVNSSKPLFHSSVSRYFKWLFFSPSWYSGWVRVSLKIPRCLSRIKCWMQKYWITTLIFMRKSTSKNLKVVFLGDLCQNQMSSKPLVYWPRKDKARIPFAGRCVIMVAAELLWEPSKNNLELYRKMLTSLDTIKLMFFNSTTKLRYACSVCCCVSCCWVGFILVTWGSVRVFQKYCQTGRRSINGVKIQQQLLNSVPRFWYDVFSFQY